MDDYKMPSFWETLWGNSWTGMDSIGRYLVLMIGAIVTFLVVMVVVSVIGSVRFRVSARRRGGHVHVTYKDEGPGIGVIVGNVVIPTRNTSSTLHFVKGKKKYCPSCSGGR